MRFPVDRKPERAIQAKIRDKKKMNMKELAEIVRNSGKNERLDEPKTRKGGSCKNEVDKRQVTISGKSPSLLGASATVKDHLHQKLLYL